MKLLFHIVRKDAARIRWLWLAWIGVLVAKVGAGVAFEHGLDVYRGYSLLNHLHGGLVGIDIVATYFLASWLVMEDAPMRTCHYSRTRPVSRGGMLAAKALGAFVLLGIAPVLVWLPWWIYCGFGALDCLREATLTLAVQALLILPAFLLGSLVDSFRRLLLWTPVWLGALFVAFFIPIMTIAIRQDTRRLFKDVDQLGLWQTRFQIAGGGLLLICVALVVCQNLRRRPRETVAVLTATWAMATAWVCFSPLNFWPEIPDTWVEDRPENARGVEVRLASATLVPSRYPEFPIDRLSLHWQSTAPLGLELIPLKTQLTLRRGDDDSLPISPTGYYHHASDLGHASRLFKHIDLSKMPRRPDNLEVDNRMAVARGRHYLREIFRGTGFLEEISWFSAVHDLPQEFRDNLDSLALRSQKLFALVEYELHGLVPLEDSNLRLNHGRGLRLTKIYRDETWASVTCVARHPRPPALHPLLNFFAPLAAHLAEESFTNDGIALIDSWNRRELPIQNLRWLKRGAAVAGGDFVVGGVSLQFVGFNADPGHHFENGRWLHRETVTDEWFNGLRLAFVTQRETARFYRETVVDPLPLTTAGDTNSN